MTDNFPLDTKSTTKKNTLITQIFKNMMISVTNHLGQIIYVNKLFCDEVGFNKDELIGRTHSLIKHEDTLDETYAAIWNKINSKQKFYGKIKNRSKNANELYHFIYIIPIIEFVCIRDKINKEDYFNNIDIGLFDYLANIRNKELLINKLKSNYKYNCALVDINKFSDINNYFGYAHGDNILQQVSSKIISIFGILNIYRYSGDIFCILIRKKSNKSFKNLILKRIAMIFKEPFYIEDNEVYLDYTIGISSGNKKNVINRSYAALKNAKNNNLIYSIFNSFLHLDNKKTYKETIQIIREIKEALNEDRITPFFQPIYDNNLNIINKYECLARIKKRNKNEYISPGVFIPICEKTKLIFDITKVMIKKSFNYFNNLPDKELSINLTVSILLNKEMTNFISQQVREFNGPRRLIFEIVENEQFPSELFNKNEFILEMKALGCKFAIDDFGSGYSNLAVFANFGYDYVKLDGSLISLINTDKGYKIVETIVTVAKNCNVKVVAEWVSDESTLEKVKKLDIEFSQGFYFGKPLEDILK
jgi:c-di-GMP phosphodiesterase